jgi:hypothetical protein
VFSVRDGPRIPTSREGSDVANAVRERFTRAAAGGHADKDMIATYFASFSEPQ